jgi:hypothetical protein
MPAMFMMTRSERPASTALSNSEVSIVRGLDRAVGEPLTLLDGPLDDFGLEAALGALDLQSAREAEVRVHADQLTLVVRDFELIAGFQLAKTFARLVELRDFREVAKIEVVLSE